MRTRGCFENRSNFFLNKFILFLGSPWRDKVSLSILDLQEKGIIQMLYDKWWKSGLTCIRDEIKNKDGKANPLDFQNIGGVFVVLFVGLVLAIMIAFVEFIYKYKNTSKTGRVSKKRFFSSIFSFLNLRTHFRLLKFDKKKGLKKLKNTLQK